MRVECAGLEERASRPRGRQHVQILVLQSDGPDEVRAPGQEPGRLRAADRLPATERDEVGAGRDEPPEVRARWQVDGAVDQDRQPVPMGDRDRVGEGQPGRLLVGLEEHARGAFVDRGSELVGRRAVGAADLHQPRARSPDEVVVAVAMDALHEHPVGTAVGLRQPVDAIGVEANEDRRRAQGERRGGAARRVARLRAGRCRDARGCGRLQIGDPHERPRGLGHRLEHGLIHERAAGERRVAACVDDRPDAQLRVDRHRPSLAPYACAP